MDQKQAEQVLEQRGQVPVLYVAFELANSTWKMACSDGGKLRHCHHDSKGSEPGAGSDSWSQAAFRYGRRDTHSELL